MLLRERRVLDETSFAEIVIWQLPRPSLGSAHRFKYRLAYVVDEVCVKHIGESQADYTFTSLDGLLEDFWAEIDLRRAL